MKTIRRMKNFVTDPMMRKMYIVKMQDRINRMPDREYIEKVFFAKLGCRPNLDNPKTLCEKLNWLKLNNRRPEYTDMVDKYKVKRFLMEKAG